MRRQRPSKVIDSSLARGIARAHMRVLDEAWDGFSGCIRTAQRRVGCLAARMTTEKALDARWARYMQLAGRFIPIATVHLNAKSRGARAMLTLEPDDLQPRFTLVSGAPVVVKVFMRPTAVHEKSLPIHVSGHAIERVIQRSRLMYLPIGRQDILAIHAEFSDALPLACIAYDVVCQALVAGALTDAGSLTILSTSDSGVFLCRWCEESSRLLIKTFIGRDQFNQAEVAAIDELRRLSEPQVAAHLLDGLAPRWLGLGSRDLHTTLLTAWRHFGWRLDEEVRLPGMSERAWEGRPNHAEIRDAGVGQG